MTKTRNAVVAIVTQADLRDGSPTVHITVKDLRPEVKAEIADADFVIYEDDSKVRSIIVYNDSVVEDAKANVQLA